MEVQARVEGGFQVGGASLRPGAVAAAAAAGAGASASQERISVAALAHSSHTPPSCRAGTRALAMQVHAVTRGTHECAPGWFWRTDSTWRLLVEIVREEGPRAVFAGLGARLAKVAPACAVMISSYEAAKLAFLQSDVVM